MPVASLNGHKLNAATKYYGCNANDSVDKSFEYLFFRFSFFTVVDRAATARSYLKRHKKVQREQNRVRAHKNGQNEWAKLALIIYIFPLAAVCPCDSDAYRIYEFSRDALKLVFPKCEFECMQRFSDAFSGRILFVVHFGIHIRMIYRCNQRSALINLFHMPPIVRRHNS